MRLKDRTALVTGASMGIGAAVALDLAKAGTKVWVVARDQERLERLAGNHDLITPLPADLTEAADRERIQHAVGDVNILVNNAGMAAFGRVADQPEAEIETMFELNVMSLIDMTKRFLPGMLERGEGHVCNVGSSVDYLSGPPLTVYAATKAAVTAFSDGLRREVGGLGVHVSLIQPGPVQTGFWDRAIGGDRDGIDEKSGAGIPASWVSSAVVRAIRFDRVPGYATVAVPRPLGLRRVLDAPGISYLLDVGAGATRRVKPPTAPSSDES